MLIDWHPSQEWFWEGNVQQRIVEYLQVHGWGIEATASTQSREHGIDILASKHGNVLALEVKGYPSSRYMRNSKVGQLKPTPSSLQARHWFAEALLSVLLRRTAIPGATFALGLPDMHRYNDLVNRSHAALDELGLSIYWVAKDGAVRAFSPSHAVDSASNGET